MSLGSGTKKRRADAVRPINQAEVAEDAAISQNGSTSSGAAASSSAQLPRARSSLDNPSKKRRKRVITPGIIYISRLPPGMTPQKVRHLMARWGDVGKVYAQGRDAPSGFNPSASASSSKRHTPANFSEAWVEFLDKDVAKTVARMLNAEVIGGKKGDRWRDDIWTMKYLSGFKWEMLGEQVAYERQAHQSRLRAEITRAKTEQGEYLRNVELARVLEKRKARKAEQDQKRRGDGQGFPPSVASEQGRGDKAGPNGEGPAGGGLEDERPRLSADGAVAKERFRQRQAVGRKDMHGQGMDAVLGSVFG